MNIQIESDLHLEFRKYSSPHQPIFSVHPDADLVVIAGDAASYAYRYQLFHALQHPDLQDKDIVYVPGNHEYYNSPGASYVVSELKSIYSRSLTNVMVIDNDYLILPDPEDGKSVLLIGSTLWSNVSSPYCRTNARGMSDFNVPGLTLDWYHNKHLTSVQRIEETLKHDTFRHYDKKVVVTHHVPSLLSIAPRYRGDSFNDFFATDLSYLMLEDWSPNLWVHGHTHEGFDYTLGKTRVVCNPAGYLRETQMDGPYRERLLVEV